LCFVLRVVRGLVEAQTSRHPYPVTNYECLRSCIASHTHNGHTREPGCDLCLTSGQTNTCRSLISKYLTDTPALMSNSKRTHTKRCLFRDRVSPNWTITAPPPRYAKIQGFLETPAASRAVIQFAAGETNFAAREKYIHESFQRLFLKGNVAIDLKLFMKFGFNTFLVA